MEAKLCLVLMLVIFGTFPVQGVVPRNRPVGGECFFDPMMTTVSCLYNFFKPAQLEIAITIIVILSLCVRSLTYEGPFLVYSLLFCF